MGKLEEIRERLEVCDKQIVSVLEDRMDIIKEIMEYKKENGLPILHPPPSKVLYYAHTTTSALLTYHCHGRYEFHNIPEMILDDTKFLLLQFRLTWVTLHTFWYLQG